MTTHTGRRRRVILRLLVFGVVGVVLSFASVLPVLWVKRIAIREFDLQPTTGLYIDLGSRFGVRFHSKSLLIDAPAEPLPNRHEFDRWWMRSSIFELPQVRHVTECAVGLPLPILSAGNALNGPRTLESWGGGVWFERLVVPYDGWNDPLTILSPPVEPYVLLANTTPTRIIWRGLIGNAVFYGVVVWGIVALMAWIRRAIRRRRGQCEGCGYSLKGLDAAAVCPECGRARKRRRRVAGDATAASAG